ncbi:MAG TPA: DUF3617 domain-containing protein [Methylibium sp.]|uniref:DUF3617 domain-containing protein n=1 Tax=Methylibium sp. TaxID=2067992 RepID=UPI002DBC74D5|nr:DUF3617 domain-containing protein [Methylibium sp.]HEU4460293.1 DUF3617 domain-containing protein [Methylibium sp.]
MSRLSCLRLFALAVVAAAPAVVSAQSLKPGLWEVQNRMQLDAAQQKQMDEMRKQMAAMPEAQRKQIEQMLAQQGAGVDVAGGGTKVRLCLTKDDVARDTPPVDARTDCSYDGKRNGATQQVRYVCTKPPSQGEIEVTTVSPERYTMKMTGTAGAGKPVAMQGEGRWLAADCGDVKPASAATPKK